MNSCIVYLSDGKELLVNGKDIYWSWFESEKTITFWATNPEDESGDDIRVAEFCKACVLAIVCIDDMVHTEVKETSFKDYLNEQMKDPEFEKEYNKLDKEFEKKIIISTGFRNAIRDAIYRTGDAACNVSKTLGLPANCLTNIILGHTKKIAYGRFCWICTALNITEYTEEHI